MHVGTLSGLSSALFVSPIVQLYRNGPHAEQEPIVPQEMIEKDPTPQFLRILQTSLKWCSKV